MSKPWSTGSLFWLSSWLAGLSGGSTRREGSNATAQINLPTVQRSRQPFRRTGRRRSLMWNAWHSSALSCAGSARSGKHDTTEGKAMPKGQFWGDSARVAVWMSARPTRNPIMETLRDAFDGGDSWGSTMEAWFAVADVLAGIDPDSIPEEWGFRQSMAGPDEDSYQYQAVLEAMADGATLQDLQHTGNVLARYAAQLKLAEMDY